MKYTVEKKIDSLGRIVLPMDFRKALGLDVDTSVSIAIRDNSIFICASDQTCKLCGSKKEISEHMGICSECIRKIKEE